MADRLQADTVTGPDWRAMLRRILRFCRKRAVNEESCLLDLRGRLEGKKLVKGHVGGVGVG